MKLSEFPNVWPDNCRLAAAREQWGLGWSGGLLYPWTTVSQCDPMQYIKTRAADGNATAQRALELLALQDLLR